MQEVFVKQLSKSPAAKQWKKIGLYPHHGVVVMLSSLHSKYNVHGGEFYDLITLIPYLKSSGFDFIQLLPLVDSGFDNSPYNPISTQALNFIYLRLQKLPYVSEDAQLLQVITKQQKAKVKNSFNYSTARRDKFTFLEKYFYKYKDRLTKLRAFKKFQQDHPWAEEYGYFCALCEKLGDNNWTNWPQPFRKNQRSVKTKIVKECHDRILLYVAIQFLCFKQLSEVKKFADKEKFFILGDLPFLVSKMSFDVWAYPQFFSVNKSVGSPPDDLTPKGQNWDFPAYNWQNLHKSDYLWWKDRLRIAENYFHMYRLDHVIGFFRTWNIPEGKEGKDGCYEPKDSSIWLENGAHFLKVLLQNSLLLPIGEDLVIPQTIKDVLRELGICGTNILTWQRTGAGGADFVPFELYNVASITHLASHDTVTVNQWWEKYPKVARLFCHWLGWDYKAKITPKQRLDILKSSHRTASLFHANLFHEYLALFPEMVHKDNNKERINYPGTPSTRNWKNRTIPSVEQIISSKKLHEKLSAITGTH